MPLNKKLRLAGSIFDTVLALLAKQSRLGKDQG
jgi:hypothetical protein